MNKAFYVFALFILCVSGINAQPEPAKTVAGGVVNGKALKLVKPKYPQAAKEALDQGTVNVQIKIDEQGNVISAEAVSGPVSLRKVSEEAALASKFAPTVLSGQAVKVTGVVVYNFIATKGDQPNIGNNLVNGGVVNGKALNLPKPKYPQAAKAIRASGTVNVQVTIDEGGNVISAKAVSGHALLRGAAEEAAAGAKFSPTLLGGKPVKITGVIIYNFVAPKKKAR